MAFRLMRYATAAMQRHLDAGHKTLPLVIPMLFYHGAKARIPFRCAGWMSLTILHWRVSFMRRHFHW